MLTWPNYMWFMHNGHQISFCPWENTDATVTLVGRRAESPEKKLPPVFGQSVHRNFGRVTLVATVQLVLHDLFPRLRFHPSPHKFVQFCLDSRFAGFINSLVGTPWWSRCTVRSWLINSVHAQWLQHGAHTYFYFMQAIKLLLNFHPGQIRTSRASETRNSVKRESKTPIFGRQGSSQKLSTTKVNDGNLKSFLTLKIA